MSIRLTSKHTELSFQYMRVDRKIENLMEFLLRRFRYLDEKEWQENINEERVLVDNKKGSAKQKLNNNQRIVYLRPDFLEPEVDANFEVVFEDDSLIAVNKSGNLPTSPSGKYFKNTLVNLVKAKMGWKKLYTLHRLDRETSGIILFAKKHEIAQIMAENFRNQKVKKTYSAILSKHLPQTNDENLASNKKEVFIDLPIGQDEKSEIRIKQAVTPKGKPSQTHFVELRNIDDYSQVEVHPFTGRTHQIRVHAAHIGCAIVGDKLYGLPNDGFIHWLKDGNEYLKSQNFPCHRQMLHALEVRFSHPVSGSETVIRTNPDTLLDEMKLYNNSIIQ